MIRLLAGLIAMAALAGCAAAPSPELAAFTARHPGLNAGFHAVDAATGEPLLSHRADTAYTPASALKALTGLYALETFGAGHRFATAVIPGAGGVLHLRMGGDPSLSHGDLAALLRRAAEAGGTGAVRGLVVDDRIFAPTPYGPGWMWDGTVLCYSAPVTGFMLDGNCFSARFTPGAGVTVAEPAFAAIDARLQAGGPAPCEPTLREAGHNRYRLEGCAAADAPLDLRVAYHDIPAYAAASLRHALAGAGIRLTGPVTFGPAPERAAPLALHHSAPLSALVADMLKRSDNLYAEALLKHLARHATGAPGDWPEGARRLQAYTAARAGGTDGVTIRDGSGLSRYTLIRPDRFAEALAAAWRADPSATGLFPEWERPGIRAKTGTMTGVAALAGYLRTQRGRMVAFAFFANQTTGPGAALRRDLVPVLADLQQRY